MNDHTIEEVYKVFSGKFCELFGVNRPKGGPTLITNYEMHKAIKEAEKTFEYDPSYLTALSFLEVKLHEGLQEIKYSLEAILFKPTSFSNEKKLVLEMQELLDSCLEYTSQKEYFIKIVKDLVDHYDTDKEFSITEILETRFTVLCSFDTLREFQFLRGQEDETAPKYIKQIYEWWNVNSLIDYATSLPNSISLHLIRHPNRYESYFCFLIKRGGNIFVFTDKMKLPSPTFSMTSRRPDRLMAENIEKNSFPYYLLGLESELGDLYEIDNADTTALVSFQKQTHILTTVSELKQESLLWVVLMFDLIYQNYFLNHKQLDELSYTVEMMAQPQRFIEKAKNNGIVPYNDSEELQHITVSSIHSDNVDSSALGNQFSKNWMEDRYSSQISDEMLNQVQPLGQKSYYQIEDKALIHSDKSKNDLVGFLKENTLLDLGSIPPTEFNTGTQLKRDRIFIARTNYVRLLEKHAQAEFKERKTEIETWFKKLCKRKQSLIIDHCKELKTKYEIVDNQFNRVDDMHDSISTHNSVFSCFNNPNPTRSVFRKREDLFKELNTAPRYSIHGEGGYDSCYATDAKASYVAIFMLSNIEEILQFFNIKLKDVPDILHNYTSNEYRSQGNSILNRTDPMADINNPFKRYDFPIIVNFSKRAYNKL